MSPGENFLWLLSNCDSVELRRFGGKPATAMAVRVLFKVGDAGALSDAQVERVVDLRLAAEARLPWAYVFELELGQIRKLVAAAWREALG